VDTSQFMNIFLVEANEYLENLNNCLLDLEKNPDDTHLLNEIFRAAHTIKGMSATMGFGRIAKLTHQMENLLDEIRKKNIILNVQVVDLLFECLDGLQIFINSVAQSGEEGDFDAGQLVNNLKKILGGTDDVSCSVTETGIEILELNMYDMKVIGKAMQEGFGAFQINVKFNAECMLKSARAFVVFNTLEKYGEIIKSVPAVEDIEDEKFQNMIKLILLSDCECEIIQDGLSKISELEDVKIEKLDLNIENTDKKIETSDLTLVEHNKSGKKKKSITGKTVRVDIDRLENLMNLVSELIIIKTRLEENSSIKEDLNTNEALEYLERITTNLHDAVMKVRMVPIERVFNRFPRMVRDLSKKLGKEISLEMYGEETEVDRTVIDEIGDPLIHLIRNSIDHGIEQVDVRKKLGKPYGGRVILKAYHDGNTVVIEVEDDGKGIDIDKIAKKAVEKGIFSKLQIEQMSEEQLVEMIFNPGFSTTNEISDLSGRGVGLDVVKTKIESLGGMVELESKKNIGSKFIIRLPLTLAIIQALLVNLGDESYALPLNSIKEIVTVKTTDIKNVQDQEVVLLRGEILPLIKLGKLLDVQMEEVNNDELIVVVVRKGEKLAGITVDRLIGQQEIVIKTLGRYLSGISHLAGATILGDGKVSLILDTNSFF